MSRTEVAIDYEDIPFLRKEAAWKKAGRRTRTSESMQVPVEEVSDYQGLPLNQFHQMETSLEEGDKYEQI